MKNELSYKDFKHLSDQGNLVPLMVELSADTETPVSAYLKMTSGKERFLFESVEGGNRWGRYSFLGSEPELIISSRGSKIELKSKRGKETHQGNSLDFVRQVLADCHPVKREGLPRFSGGLVGYLGYDIIRSIEQIQDRGHQEDVFPDMQLMMMKDVIALDNLENKLKLVAFAQIGGELSTRQAYDAACERLTLLQKRLQKRIPKVRPIEKGDLQLKANMSKKDYVAAVAKAKEYILAGDIFQVVLSLRLEGKKKVSPFEVYRRMRQINPSPYLFSLTCGDYALSGSSPEVMVRFEEGKMTLRPIAGTRRRGRTYEDDLKMEKEMLADPKERAEHIMLVDLGRNDLGRVAQAGTVKVTEEMVVERYSHVMHLVSNVEAKAKKNVDAIDVLKATFPAGTLSGAPKIRAMEVIEELEAARRGPYGGCVGYFDFFGNMDTAITIRTLSFYKDQIAAQSGAGVVLDSIPEREYLECQNKAGVMMAAIEDLLK